MLAAIHFVGNHTIDGDDLLAHMATAPTSGFFEKKARYYDADLFTIDLKRIVRWYNEKGFYEAKIDDVDEQRDAQGRVTVTVHLTEGRRAYIRKMDFVGLSAIPQGEMSDIDAALPIHPGDPFDEDGYDKAKDVLEEQLKEHGFAEAHVKGLVDVAPDDGTAHIVWTCDPGPRFHFGRVIVVGNRQIPADQIVAATGINRGDQFTPKALTLAQQRVYNLGAFSGVRVGLEPLGDVPIAAVRVTVHEAPFRTFRAGVGGSAEDTRWELPRLHGEYTDRSIFGGLRRLELSSTVGYAFVTSPLTYDPAHSGITAENSAQLTVPNVFLPGLDWVTRGEFNREVEGGFSYDQVAARTGFLYRRGSHSVAPSINFVRYLNVNLQGSSLYDVINRAGTGAGIFNECPSSCTLTYPEIRYSYDGRDNAIEPTEGFYFTTSLQQTLKPGSFSYFRIHPDFRVYLPATRFAVLAMRAMYGGLYTEGNSSSPFIERFFLGGQNDQRGYAPLRQGPKIGACAVPGCSYAQVGVPIGGNYMALFSVELRIHADFILNHLGIVPFVDASRVQDTRNVFDGGLEFAPGLGLRYLTAFGPVRFDVAWLANPIDVYTPAIPGGIDPATGKQVPGLNKTRDSVFCHPGDPTCIHEARFAFHVTLGEAF